MGWAGVGTPERARGGTLLEATTTAEAGVGTSEETHGASLGATRTSGK